MRKYILRRLILMAPTLVIVVVFVFAIVRAMPGNVILNIYADANLSPEALAREKARLGLDQPVHIQFITWAGNILQGNLGTSFWSKRPVLDDMKMRLPITFELAAMGLLIALLISIPVGVVSAVKQDTLLDYVGRSLAVGALAVPQFWLAMLTILVLSLYFNRLPALDYVPFPEDPLRNLQQFFLPALLLGINSAGTLMRMTRNTLLEVLRLDYIRTAYAKGLTQPRVVTYHAMKNALIPVVATFGVEGARVMGGAVVIELIFGLPGIGHYIYGAVLQRDYPAVQASVLFLAFVIVFINLIVDLSLSKIDPRLQLR